MPYNHQSDVSPDGVPHWVADQVLAMRDIDSPVLDLSYRDVHALPDDPEVWEDWNLKYVYLSRTGLAALPTQMGQADVRTLFAGGNRIRVLPDSYCFMIGLKELILCDNELTFLPEMIGDLSSLVYLNVNNCSLRELPDSVCDLRNLIRLAVAHNHLERLPEDVGEISSLRSLNIAFNLVSEIPTSLRFINQLEEIRIDHNPLPPFLIANVVRHGTEPLVLFLEKEYINARLEKVKKFRIRKKAASSGTFGAVDPTGRGGPAKSPTAKLRRLRRLSSSSDLRRLRRRGGSGSSVVPDTPTGSPPTTFQAPPRASSRGLPHHRLRRSTSADALFEDDAPEDGMSLSMDLAHVGRMPSEEAIAAGVGGTLARHLRLGASTGSLEDMINASRSLGTASSHTSSAESLNYPSDDDVPLSDENSVPSMDLPSNKPLTLPLTQYTSILLPPSETQSITTRAGAPPLFEADSVAAAEHLRRVRSGALLPSKGFAPRLVIHRAAGTDPKHKRLGSILENNFGVLPAVGSGGDGSAPRAVRAVRGNLQDRPGRAASGPVRGRAAGGGIALGSGRRLVAAGSDGSPVERSGLGMVVRSGLMDVDSQQVPYKPMSAPRRRRTSPYHSGLANAGGDEDPANGLTIRATGLEFDSSFSGGGGSSGGGGNHGGDVSPSSPGMPTSASGGASKAIPIRRRVGSSSRMGSASPTFSPSPPRGRSGSLVGGRDSPSMIDLMPNSPRRLVRANSHTFFDEQVSPTLSRSWKFETLMKVAPMASDDTALAGMHLEGGGGNGAVVAIYENEAEVMTMAAHSGHLRVLSATVHRLVQHLADENHPDTAFIHTFLLSYREFLTPMRLFELLVRRFNVALPDKATPAQVDYYRKWKGVVQLRAGNVVKTWVDNFWSDFRNNAALTDGLTAFVDLLEVSDLGALAGQIKAILKRQQEADAESVGERSSGSTTSGGAGDMPGFPGSGGLTAGGSGGALHDAAAATHANGGGGGGGGNGGDAINDGSTGSLGEDYSMVLKADPGVIAAQLCAIDIELVSKVPPCDFLRQVSVEGETAVLEATCPELSAFVKWFNTVVSWVSTEICLTPVLKRRILTVKNVIKVGERLRDMGNFHALRAVLSGLRAPSVQRLARTWKGLSRKSKNAHAGLEALFDPANNFATFRAEVASRRANGDPVLPFLGIFLRDLEAVNAVNNTVMATGLISWAKMRYMVDLVDGYTQICSGESLFLAGHADPVYVYLKNVLVMSESALHKFSCQCEPKKGGRSRRNKGSTRTL